jgi:hypothetical protein
VPAQLGRQSVTPGMSGRGLDRGRYFTLQQAADEFPAFTVRLLRRLVQQRRIAFSRAGRCIVVAERDIEAYIESNRVEPPTSTRRWGAAS